MGYAFIDPPISNQPFNSLVANHGLFELLDLQKYSANLQKLKLVLSKQFNSVFALIENADCDRFAQTIDQGFHDVLSIKVLLLSDKLEVP